MKKLLLLSVTAALFISHAIAQGNVGIGTNAPAYKLDVVGDVNVSSGSGYRVDGSAGSGEYLRGDGNRFTPSTIQITDLPGGSGHYIWNGTSLQTGDYRISGNGSAGSMSIGAATPDGSAALDIATTNKGVSFPNVNLLSAGDNTTITSPKKGLVVYNTGATLSPSGLYINIGTSVSPNWQKLSDASGTLSGLSVSSPLTSTGGASPTIGLGVVPVNLGGTGLTAVGAGQILIGNGSNTFLNNTLTSGTGINIASAAGSVTVNNTGDLSNTNEGSLTVGAGTATTSVISSNTSGSTDVTLEAGPNVSLTETGNKITISSSNPGGTVTQVNTGAGLTGGPITTTGTISILNGGVTNTMLANPSLTVTAGTGMSGGGSVALGSSVTLNNAGVTSNAAGSGISVSGATGAVTITNTGVTSIAAGSGISVSGSTGAVTVTATGSGLTGASTTNYVPKWTTTSTTSGTLSSTSSIYDNGNVGIGTTTPSTNLQVTGSSSYDNTYGINLTNGANDYGRTQLRLTGRIQAGNDGWSMNGRNNILFAANANSSGVGIGSIGTDKFAIQYQMLDDKLGILSSTGGASPLIVFQQNGNVGIGITTPSQKLHIAQTGALATMFLQSDGHDNAYAGGQIIFGNSTTLGNLSSGTNATGTLAFVNDGFGSGYMSMGVNYFADAFKISGVGPSGSRNSNLTIGSTLFVSDYESGSLVKKVGIGTTTPGASLDIGGTPNNAIRTAYLMISGNNTSATDRPYFRGQGNHLVIAPGTTAGASTMYLAYPSDLVSGNTVTTRIQESIIISATGSGGGGTVTIPNLGSGLVKASSGLLSIAGASDIPTGSTNYIQNQTASAQTSSNFWVSGNGTFSGGTPLVFTSTGTGTYNKTVVYHDANGVYFDLAKASDAIGATPSNFHIDARGGGSNFFHVQGSTGNVGIGTATPGNKLEVRSDGSGASWAGRLALSNSTSDRQVFLGTYNGNSVIASHNFALSAWKDLYVNTVDGNPDGNVILGGNVGVGITNPGAKLTIRGGSTDPGTYDDGKMLFVSSVSNPGTNFDGNIEFRHDNLSQGIGFGYQSIYATGSNANQDLNIYARGTGNLTLNAYGGGTGNVGIGTTTPGQKLDVLGNISVPGSAGWTIYDWANNDANWRIGMNNTDANVGFSRVLATSHVQFMSFASGAGQGFAVGDKVSGLSSFEVTGSGSSYNAYFRGNVGIGTGTPAVKLDVQGTATNLNPGCVIQATGWSSAVTLAGSTNWLAATTYTSSGISANFTDTRLINQGGAFNTASGNGTFTAPVAGFYLVTLRITGMSEGNRLLISASLNSAYAAEIYDVNVTEAACGGCEDYSWSSFIYLNAGDTHRILKYNTGTGVTAMLIGYKLI